MKIKNRFPEEILFNKDVNARTRHSVIKCCKCENQGAIPIHPNASLHPDAVGRDFRKLGWDVAKSRSDDICPQCKKKPRKPTSIPVSAKPEPIKDSPLVPLATFLEPTKEPVMEKQAAVKLEAKEFVTETPPANPTREQRRLVQAEITKHYNIEANCYKQGATDKSIAEELSKTLNLPHNIPISWVSQIREMFFGPAGNELVYGFMQEMDSIKQEMSAVREESAQAMRNALSEAAALESFAREKRNEILRLSQANDKRMADFSLKIDTLQANFNKIMSNL